MLLFDPLRFTKVTRESNSERQDLVAVAAYYRAQQRGFAPGYEVEDWLAAEVQVETELAQRRLKHLGAASFTRAERFEDPPTHPGDAG